MTSTSADQPSPERQGAPAEHRVVVLGPDGTPLGEFGPGGLVAVPADARPDDEGSERNPVDLIEQPAKVMRIGSMIKQLLEEVKSAPLDEASRARLREIHARSVKELETGLAPELVEELDRLSLPFTDDVTPSDAELRIAQAQLVGWLEGLFHGIQTALFAQQMAARAQVEELRRRAIGAGRPPGMMLPGMPGAGHPDDGPQVPGPAPDSGRSSGPYL